MILNVSGRTDIVAFYSDWFLNRYKEGFLDVRNPFYQKQVSRIYFEDVEAILFCTKNPIPILDKINQISIPILFQVTLTPYKKDLEPNVPDKTQIIQAIKKLSNYVEKDNLYVRYDPILLNDYYTVDYHLKAFEKMCSLLDGYVHHIIVSFIDDYKNVRSNSNYLNLKEFTEDDFQRIGSSFSTIANAYHMTVQTCSEETTLVEYGFIQQDCLTKEMAYQLTGRKNHKKWHARNSKFCNCVEMADIGVYNSCSHFCKYCYANYDEKTVNSNQKKHNPNSSLLIGELQSDDIITRRKK